MDRLDYVGYNATIGYSHKGCTPFPKANPIQIECIHETTTTPAASVCSGSNDCVFGMQGFACGTCAPQFSREDQEKDFVY